MNNYIISEGHIRDFVIKESYNEVDYKPKSKLMKVKCLRSRQFIYRNRIKTYIYFLITATTL